LGCKGAAQESSLPSRGLREVTVLKASPVRVRASACTTLAVRAKQRRESLKQPV
jgi:hypothetical protein